MLCLTPGALPPASISKTIGATDMESQGQPSRTAILEDSVLGPDVAAVGKSCGGALEGGTSNAYPVVSLDVERITDATAGRLATTLLAHVLFLKNQVPFPVMQLGRIPRGTTSTRASKQRAELLSSFDTISSHLDTTFSALSTALARCTDNQAHKLGQAHLAILIGPSIGTAKSKVILGIDGLEVRVWGRDRGSVSCNNPDEIEEDGNESSEDDDDDEQEIGESEEEPPSESEDEEEDEPQDVDDEDEDDCGYPPSPPPYPSHAEAQKFLQTADRLLSRTLAVADANGNGISSEMSPTQTHILIRAPRRFSHPSWIPRQNVTSSLDSYLQEFLNRSGLRDERPELDPSSKLLRRNQVEGVWITTQSGIQSQPLLVVQGQEEDEMIWWCWDGKFVGFTEW